MAGMSPTELKNYYDWQIDTYNKTEGKIEGHRCSKCNNRGDFMVLDNKFIKRDNVEIWVESYLAIADCSCKAERKFVADGEKKRKEQRQ